MRNWLNILNLLWLSWLWLLGNLCLTVEELAEVDDEISTLKMLNINDRGEVRSKDFPERCCNYRKETVTLQINPNPGPVGYIHASFDDLDIPVGSIFRIYTDDEETNLYEDQADFKFGVWRRPFLTSQPPSNKFHIVLKPPPENTYNKTRYTGFKISYYVSRDKDPLLSYTSELCGRVGSVAEGDEIRVKPQTNSRFHGLWLNCLWVLKPPLPHEIKAINSSDVKVYAIFHMMTHLDKGGIEVRRGTNSEGPLLVTEEHLADSLQPSEGFTSSNGLYIRAIIAADDKNSRFSFVFGYAHILKDVAFSEQCESGGGFLCWPDGDFCLPGAHVCNHVNNCPDASDERDCPRDETNTSPSTETSSAAVTTTTTTTTAATTTSKISEARCELWEKDCGVNGCLRNFFDTCPGECSYHEKKCSNGDCISSNYYCNEEACPYYDEYRCGLQCYSSSDKCDDVQDCTDGTDEMNCAALSNMDNLFWMMLIPAGILVICFLCFKAKNKQNSENENGSAATTTVTTTPASNQNSTRAAVTTMHYPTSRAPLLGGDTRSTSSSQTVGTTVIPIVSPVDNPDPPDASELTSVQAPPPTYEEVTTTGAYPQLSAPSEPPPPSYELAVQGSVT